MNPTHTTADVIVQSLIKHGVDTVFGLPGVQTYPMFDAPARSDIQVIGARHEQGAAYMAFGYTQATGACVFSNAPGVIRCRLAVMSGGWCGGTSARSARLAGGRRRLLGGCPARLG